MKTRFFVLAALALAAAACDNDSERPDYDGRVAARFTADITPATRVSGTAWDEGDRIGITGAAYTNIPFILKEGRFCEDGLTIYYEDSETQTFNAYYPYDEAGGLLTATTDAAAQQNQTTIDYLFAAGATGSYISPVVKFTDKTDEGGDDNSFHHSMSRITLTFKAGDGVYFNQIKPESYTLDGVKLTGTFDTTTGTAAAGDEAQAGTLTMELADGNLSSSVILFPQTAASLSLVVRFNSQEYKATLTLPDGALKAGNNYTYTVTVRNQKIEVGDAEIASWIDVPTSDGVNATL